MFIKIELPHGIYIVSNSDLISKTWYRWQQSGVNILLNKTHTHTPTAFEWSFAVRISANQKKNMAKECWLGSEAEIIKITVITCDSNEIDFDIGQASFGIRHYYFLIPCMVFFYELRFAKTHDHFCFATKIYRHTHTKITLMIIASVAMSAIAIHKMIWCSDKKKSYKILSDLWKQQFHYFSIEKKRETFLLAMESVRVASEKTNVSEIK